MFIDTHCHISIDYYDDIDNLINNNLLNDVGIMIVSGCDKKSIDETINLIDSYKCLYATIGYHPSEVNDVNDDDIDKLVEFVKCNKKVVGIGEIGLDYHYGKEDKDKQIVLFEKQLCLAEKFNLPVIIHTRDEVEDTINILKKYKVSGIIHCFSGSLEVANVYIKMGYKLGIGGVLTFRNSKLYDVVEKVDIKNIVLETDSPYLAPEPFRGSVNSSKNIPVIAQKIADIKKLPLSTVKNITTDNAISLFKLLLKK